MSDTRSTATRSITPGRLILLALLVALAFFASYRFALAARGDAGAGSSGAALTATDPSSAACACCGGAGSSEPIEGSATTDADGVQRVTVDTSTGSYDPNLIKLAAGVPAEITFKQASGCLGQVMSEQLGFFEDLSAGDKTIRLDALEPGTYEFSCGMKMVFGQIVVE